MIWWLPGGVAVLALGLLMDGGHFVESTCAIVDARKYANGNGLVELPVISGVNPEGIVAYQLPGAWNYTLWRPLVCLSDWTWAYDDWRVDSPGWWRLGKASQMYRLYRRSGWYVSGYCSIFRDNSSRYARAHMWWFQNNPIRLGAGYRGAYAIVYATCQGASENYAHWVFDHLAWVMAVPSHILQDCVVVFPSNKFSDSLALCGIGNVLWLNRENYIWAETLYQWDPIPADWQEPAVLWPLREFLVQRLDLDRQPPYVYGVLARDGWRMTRRLRNLGEWFARWQAEYPGRCWRNSTGFRSVRDAGPWFNPLRLLFTPHGAGCVNILFMQPGTAFGEVLSSNIRACAYFAMSRMLGLHHVSYKKPDFHHFQRDVLHDLFDFEGSTIMQALMAGLGEAATVVPPSPRPKSSLGAQPLH